MSHQSTNSVTSSVNVRHRISNTPRKPRPASIHVTGVTHDLKNNDKGDKPPIPKTRKSLSKTNTSEKIDKCLPRNKPAVKSPSEETAPKVVGVDKKEFKPQEPPQVKEVKPPAPDVVETK